MKKIINLGLIGFGVVGSGTMRLLQEHKRDIESRVGAKCKVLWVVSRHKKTSPYLKKDIKQTSDWKKVINDPKVDCVVELIGGIHPAKEIVVSALRAGKHVVTANKAILAKYWKEIFSLARKKKKLVYFEAAVGGGVPIIQALNEGLAGNQITQIQGILNGTTNYILTKMTEDGLSFQSALEEAQQAGLAEANPTFDVEGIDAAQKISILGSLAVGQWVKPDGIYCEGISKIQQLDLKLIEEYLKGTCKLVGLAEKTKKGWTFRVHPLIVAKSHPFANVRNEYNAISVTGNATKDVMLYGKGAGQLPTSSAVISDLIFLCRQIANGTAGQFPYVHNKSSKILKTASMSQIQSRYYLRVNVSDHPGVLSKITGILGKNGVSIASIHQTNAEKYQVKRGIPIVLVTHKNLESSIQASVQAINKLSSTVSKTVVMRMA